MSDFSTLDGIALIWFIFSWVFYSWFVEHGPNHEKTLSAKMNKQREEWLRIAITRDLRIVDSSICAVLQSGTAFFASTSLLAIGGCFAMLGSSEQVVKVMQDMPFTPNTSSVVWEMKAIGLAGVFAYAFFKFGWSYRLSNYTSILVGALPLASSLDEEAKETALQRTLVMNQSSGRHFNRGLRAFFFSIGFAGWFAGPIPFIIATSWIVLTLYNRQYRSIALQAFDSDEKTI